MNFTKVQLLDMINSYKSQILASAKLMADYGWTYSQNNFDYNMKKSDNAKRVLWLLENVNSRLSKVKKEVLEDYVIELKEYMFEMLEASKVAINTFQLENNTDTKEAIQVIGEIREKDIDVDIEMENFAFECKTDILIALQFILALLKDKYEKNDLYDFEKDSLIELGTKCKVAIKKLNSSLNI